LAGVGREGEANGVAADEHRFASYDFVGRGCRSDRHIQAGTLPLEGRASTILFHEHLPASDCKSLLFEPLRGNNSKYAVADFYFLFIYLPRLLGEVHNVLRPALERKREKEEAMS
jgi:hypothetical protein